MKTAREFLRSVVQIAPPDAVVALEAREREVRAAALREAVEAMSKFEGHQVFGELRELAERAERGEP